MKKEDAIKILSKSAKEYHINLENNNVLFISGPPGNPHYLETVFLPRHFLHLTGIQLSGRNNVKSADFYKKCLRGQLSPHDFFLASDGTTEMKLNVILPLMNIHKTAKMMGDYNFAKTLLYTQKLTGSVSGCIGFTYSKGYFNPNTLLNEDIRDITYRPQSRILAILRKPISKEIYTELCYVAKGIHLDEIKLSNDISAKIAVSDFNF